MADGTTDDERRAQKKARERRYRERNKDKIRERRKRYRQEHKQEIADYARRAREADPDKFREWNRQWAPRESRESPRTEPQARPDGLHPRDQLA